MYSNQKINQKKFIAKFYRICDIKGDDALDFQRLIYGQGFKEAAIALRVCIFNSELQNSTSEVQQNGN